MEQKRPQGRQKYVTNDSKGAARRGQGLGTGPVGRGSRPTNTPAQSGSRAGGQAAPTRSRGSMLLIVIVAIVVLMGGGGGLLSGLLGGTGSTEVQLDSPAQTQASVSLPADNGGTAADETVAEGSRAKYTQILGNGQDTVNILVYMCGTDLESKYSMATKDLVEMQSATLSDNLRIFVYTGGCTKWNNSIVSNQKNQIYQIVDGGIKCLEADMGSASMTKPDTLASFLKWAKEKHPASRNELILWDHGGGSVSGYGYDEKNAKSGSMSLSGINQALKSADMKFDFIGFDACLMATVENGLMLNEYADYMIASEETEPGIGWYYTRWLTSFAADTSMPTVDVGKLIVDDFVSTCNSQCQGQKATLSVVDLAELSNTAPAALRDFSQELSQRIADQDYSEISSARSNTREFAQSSRIDQIDLVDFAGRVGGEQGKALSQALLGAVKYNRTSANMANGSNGLSIYFPYRKASSVSSALNTYDAIGMEESYAQCIREFAALEVSGQVSTGGDTSALPSLLGSFSGSSGGSDMIGDLLGSFLGSGGGSFFTGRAMTEEETVAYISDHYFDSTNLFWTKNDAGQDVIVLSEEQYGLLNEIAVNLFLDDGEGFIDLGIDNVPEYDGQGNLMAPSDRTWVAVNGQIVAFYYDSYVNGVTYGYIPAMLNGERVELLAELPDGAPGAIVGARRVYTEGETETVAKNTEALSDGDTIDFLCDYYSYDGTYRDSYYLGEQMTVSGAPVVSNTDVGAGGLCFTYRLTDIYQQHYWTEPFLS